MQIPVGVQTRFAVRITGNGMGRKTRTIKEALGILPPPKPPTEPLTLTGAQVDALRWYLGLSEHTWKCVSDRYESGKCTCGLTISQEALGLQSHNQ